jgi:hypothetical protein
MEMGNDSAQAIIRPFDGGGHLVQPPLKVAQERPTGS